MRQTGQYFDADIVVEKDGEEVDGKSILGLMMLAVGHGSKITITAEGKDEQEALNALEDLISASLKKIEHLAHGHMRPGH
ncbi:MAG: HPr family phosphocarrier protein [Akkermansia sp.]